MHKKVEGCTHTKLPVLQFHLLDSPLHLLLHSALLLHCPLHLLLHSPMHLLLPIVPLLQMMPVLDWYKVYQCALGFHIFCTYAVFLHDPLHPLLSCSSLVFLVASSVQESGV